MVVSLEKISHFLHQLIGIFVNLANYADDDTRIYSKWVEASHMSSRKNKKAWSPFYHKKYFW